MVLFVVNTVWSLVILSEAIQPVDSAKATDPSGKNNMQIILTYFFFIHDSPFSVLFGMILGIILADQCFKYDKLRSLVAPSPSRKYYGSVSNYELDDAIPSSSEHA